MTCVRLWHSRKTHIQGEMHGETGLGGAALQVNGRCSMTTAESHIDATSNESVCVRYFMYLLLPPNTKRLVVLGLRQTKYSATTYFEAYQWSFDRGNGRRLWMSRECNDWKTKRASLEFQTNPSKA